MQAALLCALNPNRNNMNPLGIRRMWLTIIQAYSDLFARHSNTCQRGVLDATSLSGYSKELLLMAGRKRGNGR